MSQGSGEQGNAGQGSGSTAGSRIFSASSCLQGAIATRIQKAPPTSAPPKAETAPALTLTTTAHTTPDFT
ncbi:uncharacterized protein TrAtP1_004911 [Trichoderma atroviride]|uniref:uncharacterized protein n=1 Tax=Hypocrea atroviridis TaxID=63577 RepID=UPI003323D0CC|nr:hypothetical protein TrAtP1_004911 [Trichoderma atroviride]